jgi:hypothetical protein
MTYHVKCGNTGRWRDSSGREWRCPCPAGERVVIEKTKTTEFDFPSATTNPFSDDVIARQRTYHERTQRAAGARGCAVPFCPNPTTDRKKYCFDHIDHQPYVRRMLRDMTARERELNAAVAHGHEAIMVDSSPAVTELLLAIFANGYVTLQAVGSLLSIGGIKITMTDDEKEEEKKRSKKRATAYVVALTRRSLVKVVSLQTGKKKIKVLRLTETGLQFLEPRMGPEAPGVFPA